MAVIKIEIESQYKNDLKNRKNRNKQFEMKIYVLTSVDRNRDLSEGLCTMIFTDKKDCIDHIMNTLSNWGYFANEDEENEKAIFQLRKKVDKCNEFHEPDICFFNISEHNLQYETN